MSSKDKLKEKENGDAMENPKHSTDQENIENASFETENENEEENTNADASAEIQHELQQKYDSLNDKYLRLYSEYENYRRRTAREILEAKLTGGSDLAVALLPVLDDFDRAIELNKNTADIDTLKEGFSLIHNKLKRTLENKGLKEMESLETPFDTDFHDAITHIPAATEELKGKVVDVAEKGYFFNDKIIRHAKVVVGK